MGLKEQLGSDFHCLPDIGERARFHKAARNAARNHTCKGLGGYRVLDMNQRAAPESFFCWDEWKTLSGHYSYDWLLRYYVNLQGEQNSEQETLITVDFGGGLGYEMVRLAAGRYYQEVKEGRMVFVVTNLGCDPMGMGIKEIRKWTRRETEQMTNQQWETYIKNRYLVNFLTGDINELRRKTIFIQGKKVPLWGNVDLIHERLALCHGYVPEIELPTTALMLKSGGRLLLSSIGPGHHKRVCRSEGISESSYSEGWKLGLANLQAVGVETQNSPLTDYRVYKRVTQ